MNIFTLKVFEKNGFSLWFMPWCTIELCDTSNVFISCHSVFASVLAM